MVLPGCSGSRSPPGTRRRGTLAYPWRKGSPGSPCLPGLAAGCRKRWAMGRAALAGLAAACYLSMAGRERVQNLRPSQPAHSSARHLPRALLIHSPGGRAGLGAPVSPLLGCLGGPLSPLRCWGGEEGGRRERPALITWMAPALGVLFGSQGLGAEGVQTGRTPQPGPLSKSSC